MGNEAEMQDIFQLALMNMGDTPRSLEKAMQGVALARDASLATPVSAWFEKALTQAGPNSEVVHVLGLSLRNWDRLVGPVWGQGTEPISAQRRSSAYRCMGIPAKLDSLVGKLIPVFTAREAPVVIAEKHLPWYDEARRRGRFYWEAYVRYLHEKKNWSTDAIASLDEATDDVIGRLSDPTRDEAYQAKGLVVGYVQSGKTAHFTGVLAKAADAGYRLIVVMAGVLDLLREQTQRRIDKELVGKELLENEYSGDQDWKDFNSYGERPSAKGQPDWERLTGSKVDYQELKLGIAALEFKCAVPEKPFYDPANLRSAPIKLVVIKKNSKVIAKLVKDLGRIKSRLGTVPTLLVDDESDQASINTVNPDKATKDERTATNKAIVGLLRVLPRAQYVGYTATPFANALINPDDVDDLFPRDFIVALPRPKGYMGVSDFYDSEPPPTGYLSNQKAFVRDVTGDDAEERNLRKAIDSFVLAGAIKIFREQKDSKGFRFDHHTMLVHHSTRRVVHEDQAKQIRDAYQGGDYLGNVGKARLEKLFSNDFAPVNAAQAPDLPFPQSFDELRKMIGPCLQRINTDNAVRIVNGDDTYKDQAPNFEKGPVWSILVGGAKLSRGYTVEGLTTTYYRRVATASDTLMQMGRWLGFRPGFRDLVRLFIGRNEPVGTAGKKTLDLYEAFHALSLDEEEFRRDIEKYVRDGLTPLAVPPLIPSHITALSPTAKNKMYNARIVFKNFGGKRIERTVTPNNDKDAARNGKFACDLISRAALKLEHFEFRDPEKTPADVSFEAYCGECPPRAVLTFLKDYIWESREDVLKHEIEFLEGKRGNPEIDRWIILAPTMRGGANYWPKKDVPHVPKLPIRERGRIGRRIKVFSEPDHVSLANYLAGRTREDDGTKPQKRIKPISPNIARLKAPKTAVLLLYAVEAPDDQFVTIGFALQFPPNKHDNRLVWTVKKKAGAGKPLPVVVDID